MNSAVIVGNLTRDPEQRRTQNGKDVTTMSVAVNRAFGEGADFFTVVVWGTQAVNCAKYLKKGRKVAVKGSMESRSYEKDGQKRTVWELRADNVEFLTAHTGEKDMTEVHDADDPFNDMPF